MAKPSLRWKRTVYHEPNALLDFLGAPVLIGMVLVAALAMVLDVGPFISSVIAALASVALVAGALQQVSGGFLPQKTACTLGADGVQFPDGRFYPWPQIRYVEPEQLPSATQNTSPDTIVIGIAEAPVRVRVSDPMAFVLDASQRRAYHNALQNEDNNEEYKSEAHVGYRSGIKKPTDNLVRVALDVSKAHDSRLEAYARLDVMEREALFNSLADETFRESLEDIQ